MFYFDVKCRESPWQQKPLLTMSCDVSRMIYLKFFHIFRSDHPVYLKQRMQRQRRVI